MGEYSTNISYKLTCLSCLKKGDWNYVWRVIYDKADEVLGIPNEDVDDEYFHNYIMDIYKKQPLACMFCGCINRFSISAMKIGENKVWLPKSKQKRIIEQNETLVIEFEKITNIVLTISTKQIRLEPFFNKAFLKLGAGEIKIDKFDSSGKNINLFSGKIRGIEFKPDSSIKEMHGLHRVDDDAIWERFLITTEINGFAQYKFNDRNNFLFQPDSEPFLLEPNDERVFYLLSNIVSEGYQVGTFTSKEAGEDGEV
jgi:hypothetical protein